MKGIFERTWMKTENYRNEKKNAKQKGKKNQKEAAKLYIFAEKTVAVVWLKEFEVEVTT